MKTWLRFGLVLVLLRLSVKVKVRQLVVMVRVRVRSWIIQYAFESPHKDRNARMCVSVCVCKKETNAGVTVM